MGVTGLDKLSHWPREVFKSQLLLWRTLETYLCSAVLFGWIFESVVSTDIRVVSHVFTQSDQIRLLSTWKKTTKTSLGQHAAMWELTGNKPACSQGENVTSLQRGELGKSDVKGRELMAVLGMAGWRWQSSAHHSWSGKTFKPWCCPWDLQCFTLMQGLL